MNTKTCGKEMGVYSIFANAGDATEANARLNITFQSACDEPRLTVLEVTH